MSPRLLAADCLFCSARDRSNERSNPWVFLKGDFRIESGYFPLDPAKKESSPVDSTDCLGIGAKRCEHGLQDAGSKCDRKPPLHFLNVHWLLAGSAPDGDGALEDLKTAS